MVYPIEMYGKVVGKASLNRLGLYAEIKCKCYYTHSGFHRLYMEFTDKKIDLGILTREDNAYIISKRISSKSLGCGDVKFRIRDATERTGEKVKLVHGQPVILLHKIMDGVLASADKDIFLLFQLTESDESASSQ